MRLAISKRPLSETEDWSGDFYETPVINRIGRIRDLQSQTTLQCRSQALDVLSAVRIFQLLDTAALVISVGVINVVTNPVEQLLTVNPAVFHLSTNSDLICPLTLSPMAAVLVFLPRILVKQPSLVWMHNAIDRPLLPHSQGQGNLFPLVLGNDSPVPEVD